MDDCRPYLTLDIVADDRQAGIAEFLHPFGIRGNEDWNAIYHRDAGIKTGLRIVFDRLFGANGQIAEQNLGARRTQRLSNIGRLEVGRTEGHVIRVFGHMRSYPIKHGAGLNNHVRHREGALKDAGAVWLGEDRLVQRATDFAPVYVKRRDKGDVGTAIAADRWAHHALDRSALAMAVIFHALH